MTKLIRIFIADDHEMFVDGVKALLQTMEGVEVCGSAVTGSEVLSGLADAKADVVLMDIGMPDMDGIETTQAVLKKYPSQKIIALTMYDEPHKVMKMLKAGAKGYVLKNTSKIELMEAIRAVAAGGVFYSDKIMLETIKSITAKEDPLTNLTEREIEIIRLIVKSLTNKEIADQLCISELTVNTHRKNAMRKLAIKNTAGLVKFAIDNGL